jgi:hypothetical protein
MHIQCLFLLLNCLSLCQFGSFMSACGLLAICLHSKDVLLQAADANTRPEHQNAAR